MSRDIEKEIKPCMWCKRQPEIIYVDHTPPREIYNKVWGYIICCPHCRVKTFEGMVKEGVVQYWNNVFGVHDNE